MIPLIFDDKDGIIIQFDLENGLALSVNMDDATAQEMINIIHNKLNARL